MVITRKEDDSRLGKDQDLARLHSNLHFMQLTELTSLRNRLVCGTGTDFTTEMK